MSDPSGEQRRAGTGRQVIARMDGAWGGEAPPVGSADTSPAPARLRSMMMVMAGDDEDARFLKPLLSMPPGLAVGLAPKERRYGRWDRFAPVLRFPRIAGARGGSEFGRFKAGTLAKLPAGVLRLVGGGLSGGAQRCPVRALAGADTGAAKDGSGTGGKEKGSGPARGMQEKARRRGGDGQVAIERCPVNRVPLPSEASLSKRPDKTFNLRGGLQAEVMDAVWKLGEAKVEDVRSLQPRHRRSAYTTLQTVMNRLVEYGLLMRERRGSAFYYRAKYDEADYIARTISERLASASPNARQEALVHLVGGLEPSELNELTRYAGQIRRKRKKGRES